MSSSTTTVNKDVEAIISYWFAEPNPALRWFMKDPKVDEEIREKFGHLVTQARSSSLDSTWLQDPKGTLALLILLDQFPRNLFRGSGESFSSDAKAASIATKAIAEGVDREVSFYQQLFFYLPLVHAEDLLSQVTAVALAESYNARAVKGSDEEKLGNGSLESSIAHKKVIMRFGRYPARNEALGRASTEEEIEFLKESPGF